LQKNNSLVSGLLRDLDVSKYVEFLERTRGRGSGSEAIMEAIQTLAKEHDNPIAQAILRAIPESIL
jgi:hypothetical protein